MSSNDMLVEMLKIVNGLRDDMKENRKEILTIVNDLKDEVKENRKEILTIVNDLNNLKEEVKENRKEIQKSREIEEAHWQENLRRWKENDKKWEENNKRWEENEKRWQENDKRWEKYETNRKADRKFLLDTLTVYDISISEQLGDPNVEKMRKIVV